MVGGGVLKIFDRTMENIPEAIKHFMKSSLLPDSTIGARVMIAGFTTAPTQHKLQS